MDNALIQNTPYRFSQFYKYFWQDRLREYVWGRKDEGGTGGTKFGKLLKD